MWKLNIMFKKNSFPPVCPFTKTFIIVVLLILKKVLTVFNYQTLITRVLAIKFIYPSSPGP